MQDSLIGPTQLATTRRQVLLPHKNGTKYGINPQDAGVVLRWGGYQHLPHPHLPPLLCVQKSPRRPKPQSSSLAQTLEHLNSTLTSFIFTFDVEALYPSIPPKIRSKGLRKIITPHFSTSKTSLIYTLSVLALEYSFLSFDKVIYQQINDIAIDSKLSLVYACPFLA